jgi:hypothetical protein
MFDLFGSPNQSMLFGMFGFAACRTTDEIGSPNQCDYLNPSEMCSKIFFTHTIKGLWRQKPWE